MKNIYVLTALSPSRLSDCHNNKLYLDDTRYLKNYKELFITSDEKIIKGDWVLLRDIMKLYKVEYTSQCPDYNDDTDIKKIILTTDSQLIKDGIQAIDDEFLEWWINNPSCEFVETRLIEQRSHLSLNDWVNTDKDGKFPISIAGAFCYRKIYKIIIPKKKQCTCEHPSDNTCNYCDEQLSKQILEEASKNAQQQMYSEEEVEDLIYKVCGTVARLQEITLNGNHIDTAYGQFKKK